ncbi:hypothetical protein BC938DRAFT_484040 [Jimgerdemannia flammicorona]|uniref:Uncharacterized protein n=1 Tax=Jimgerdemannia flammicorona TaxID=994334 RepID=A0A433QVC8_9FUNG|nr:hypothetical protein BC938DRAFT_484040 [Jimgerdemannia flammicorona]
MLSEEGLCVDHNSFSKHLLKSIHPPSCSLSQPQVVAFHLCLTSHLRSPAPSSSPSRSISVVVLSDHVLPSLSNQVSNGRHWCPLSETGRPR